MNTENISYATNYLNNNEMSSKLFNFNNIKSGTNTTNKKTCNWAHGKGISKIAGKGKKKNNDQ